MLEIAGGVEVQGSEIVGKSYIKMYLSIYVEEYINQTLMKIRTEGDETTVFYPRHSSMPPEEVSLTISQDKSAINDPTHNQSQFLSFSLTSVLEESTDKEQLTSGKRKIEHAKAGSDVPVILQVDDKKLVNLPSFRKSKK